MILSHAVRLFAQMRNNCQNTIFQMLLTLSAITTRIIRKQLNFMGKLFYELSLVVPRRPYDKEKYNFYLNEC